MSLFIDTAGLNGGAIRRAYNVSQSIDAKNGCDFISAIPSTPAPEVNNNYYIVK